MAGRRIDGSGSTAGFFENGGICANGDHEALLVGGCHGSQLIMNSDDSQGRYLKFDLYETDSDELTPKLGKQKRLRVDQVRFLEKYFELENKLEPERKLQLANDLGLEPRQVAIWFQNRRARLKTKHLEKEYESLKSSYDKLKVDRDNLAQENEKLKSEVVFLTDKLVKKEKTFKLQESIDMEAEAIVCRQEGSSPANAALEHESPMNGFHLGDKDKALGYGFLRSDHHPCSYELQVEDQTFWSWP
ncbi:homeobox-leucine zipper protein HAT5-like isoform X2 [Curcuma longa]|uniref:homeobox-leucine zipper protein HAT5-like isoform X2 n=1 Tax=Curcuma longa TaxID=136217 RepID=UPI003D9F304E